VDVEFKYPAVEPQIKQLVQLETCTQSFLRWANGRAELNTLTQMLTKGH
jgi:hypothetical protein